MDNDSIPCTDSVSFSGLASDSLSGDYNFIISPGFVGRRLTIKPNHIFYEKPWSDMPHHRHHIRGHWQTKANYLVLKHGFYKLKLFVHHYNWATFLIPESKYEKFACTFARNKYLVDSIAPYVKTMKSYETHSVLRAFRTLCFVKLVKNYR